MGLAALPVPTTRNSRGNPDVARGENLQKAAPPRRVKLAPPCKPSASPFTEVMPWSTISSELRSIASQSTVGSDDYIPWMLNGGATFHGCAGNLGPLVFVENSFCDKTLETFQGGASATEMAGEGQRCVSLASRLRRHVKGARARLCAKPFSTSSRSRTLQVAMYLRST